MKMIYFPLRLRVVTFSDRGTNEVLRLTLDITENSTAAAVHAMFPPPPRLCVDAPVGLSVRSVGQLIAIMARSWEGWAVEMRAMERQRGIMEIVYLCTYVGTTTQKTEIPTCV